MNKLERFLLILGLTLLLPATARPAPDQEPQEGWQVYTNGNYVFDLALEGGGALGGGYTWAATGGGVVCYSASEQVKFTTLDGLADNYVASIAEDSEGRWWFGTNGGGVSVLDDGGTSFDKGDDVWTTFTTNDGLTDNNVWTIAAGGGGRWWFGTWGGGASILDDAGTPFDKRDDTWIAFTESDGLAHNDVNAIAADGEGRWWFGTGGGISVLNDGSTPFDKGDDIWISFTESDGLAHNLVDAIAEDGGGRWWFSTREGVSVLDNGGTPFDKGDDTWLTFTESDGLVRNNYIYAIAVDGAGRLWFGAHGGVSVLDNGGTPFDKGDDTWITFTSADGLANDAIFAIAEDGGGRWWFGTWWGGGVSVLDDGGTPFDKGDDTWTTFAIADGLTYNFSTAIATDGGGRLWFGTFGRGVSVLDDSGTPFEESDDTWISFTESDGLVCDHILAVVADSSGRWWFGASDGVSVLDNGGTPFDKEDDAWISFTESDGLAGRYRIQAIAVDGEGYRWFGAYDSGVSVLDDGGTLFNKGDDIWTIFTESDGLADSAVNAIAVDGGGRLWFGTGEGVSVLDDGGTPFDKGDDTWITFTTNDGLANNSVEVIVVDDGGRLWFGAGSWIYAGGVSVLDYGGTPFDKGDDIWITFTESDGLASAYVRAIAMDGGGRWWFGMRYGGVSVLDDGGTPFDKGDDTWTTFTTNDGLANNSVGTIVEDSGGRLWFDTNGGVSELVDAVPPTSSASSPAYANGPIPVSWSASDGASGVFSASLWVKYGSGGTWTDTSLSQRGEISGTFTYVPTQGTGIYYFATVAEDWMGNVEAAPTGLGDANTVYDLGDAYEPDDVCAHANAIPTDGTVQVHTFHDGGDKDWVSFQATAGVTYVIKARIPPTSAADVVLELYGACDGTLKVEQDVIFSPDVQLTFPAPASSVYYLRLLNHDPAVYGPDVAYHLSVRDVQASADSGALVLVAGRGREDDVLQDNIHHVITSAYRLALAQGCAPDDIYLLATDLDLDADGDGQPDVDGLPNDANLEYAITQWAVGKVGPERPLTLYLMDHGGVDVFYLDDPAGQSLTPDELDGWLDQLTGATLGTPINVIVEACYAGSFIDPLNQVSQEQRVVIASTGSLLPAYASAEGAIFSDAFLSALGQGMSLQEAFEEGRWAVGQANSIQTPWLDDDGDGEANEAEDGAQAALRGFACAPPNEVRWPPNVLRVEVRDVPLGGGQGTIWAEAQDDEGVSRAWAVVYPPSWPPPGPGDEMLPGPPPVTLQSHVGGWWYSEAYEFDESGVYRVVVYAEDEDGLEGRPKELELQIRRVYLPLVMRATMIE